jgi:hypothetical protein
LLKVWTFLNYHLVKVKLFVKYYSNLYENTLNPYIYNTVEAKQELEFLIAALPKKCVEGSEAYWLSGKVGLKKKNF